MKIAYRAAFLAGALPSLFACAATNASSGNCWPACPPAANDAARYLHAADVPSIVKPFLSPQGFLDPAFAPTVAYASPVLTDFFGLQALADVPRDRIIGDFVPQHASLVADDANSVTLDFKRGFTGTFYPVSSLQAAGITAPISHVRFTGEDWRQVRGNSTSFLQLLKETGLSHRYLLPNAFYEDERATEAQLKGGTAAMVRIDPELAGFTTLPNAVLILGERVHGQSGDADKLMEILRSKKIDWLGMEMLPTEFQPQIDAFNLARRGTPAYDAARARLLAYFTNAWNGRAGPKTTGEANYYFKVVELAHERGVRVIALEGATVPYLIFRYGETDFGGSVRSKIWVDHLPSKGRGIVFGGSAHFNAAGPINVQDFLALRDHGRPIFTMTELKKRSAT